MKIIQIEVVENNKVYDLLIGRNKVENDELIKKSLPNDIWFHLDKLSGPHFVLKSNGDYLHKKYLNYIASLFREYKTNLPNKYTVIFTEIKHVIRTNTPGEVIPHHCRKIKI